MYNRLKWLLGQIDNGKLYISFINKKLYSKIDKTKIYNKLVKYKNERDILENKFKEE